MLVSKPTTDFQVLLYIYNHHSDFFSHLVFCSCVYIYKTGCVSETKGGPTCTMLNQVVYILKLETRLEHEELIAMAACDDPEKPQRRDVASPNALYEVGSLL